MCFRKKDAKTFKTLEALCSNFLHENLEFSKLVCIFAVETKRHIYESSISSRK